MSFRKSTRFIKHHSIDLTSHFQTFRIPYQNTEELVQAGLVKKLVAAIPVVTVAEDLPEQPTESTTAALEDQEMIFIAPTDAPAIVEAAEEVATEASAEEVPADVAADAVNTEGDTTEV